MSLTRVLAALSLSLLLLIAAAPASFAQGVPEVGDVTGTAGDATGTVEDTAGTATEAVEDSTSGATETVNDTTEQVTDTVNDATGSVENTAGDAPGTVTETVNNATGGGNGGGNGNGGPIPETVTNTVNNALGGGGNGSGSGSGSTGSSVLDNVLGGVLGSDSPLTPDLVDDLVDEAAGLGLSPTAAEGWIDGKTIGSSAYEDPVFVLGAISGLLGDFATDLTVATSSSSGDVAFSTESSGSSLFGNAGRVAVEAAKTLAFPLALALMVVGFLAVQGRIGRKDPKLALAPVDIDEESLAFE